jgi:hypothetical protein
MDHNAVRSSALEHATPLLRGSYNNPFTESHKTAYSHEMTDDDSIVAIRWLQQAAGNNTTSTTVQKYDKSFMLLLTIIVSLILTFYAFCMYQVCRRYVLCKRPRANDGIPGANGTILVHEGQQYNLSEGQRRAVLEAIFSEVSKVSLKQCRLLMVLSVLA